MNNDSPPFGVSINVLTAEPFHRTPSCFHLTQTCHLVGSAPVDSYTYPRATVTCGEWTNYARALFTVLTLHWRRRERRTIRAMGNPRVRCRVWIAGIWGITPARGAPIMITLVSRVSNRFKLYLERTDSNLSRRLSTLQLEILHDCSVWSPSLLRTNGATVAELLAR